MNIWRVCSMVAAGSAGFLVSTAAFAATIQATPSTYKAELGKLTPGDTLELASGHYPRLNLTGIKGAPNAFITITGPSSGEPATIDADLGPCCNTVQLDNTAYVAIKNMTIDGKNVDAADGINAKGNPVHDILIENVEFIGHTGSQQTVAISTKTTAWNWVIRRNRIIGAGTGIYLGNSNGAQPFVAGIIEENFIDDTTGYGMQIKYQKPRVSVEGLPTGPSKTIIRNNVFVKRDRPSEDGDRPNLLVGGFPEKGDGSEDRYEIYGNFFYHNPREALLQASGRVSIHDNVFVDAGGSAIVLQNHDLPLRQAYVYNNTIYGAATGIQYSGAGDQGTHFIGNVIFAATPIAGKAPTSSIDNVVGSESDAASYVVKPSRTFPIDLYPLAGKLEGGALDLSKFSGDTDWDLDFNGTKKGNLVFRGAYAGSGANPGWPLALGPKSAHGSTPNDDVPGGGTSGGGQANAPSGDPAVKGAAGADGRDGGDGGDGGCSVLAGNKPSRTALPLLFGLLVMVRLARSTSRGRAAT